MVKLVKRIEKVLIWGILLVLSIILFLSFIDVVFEIKEKILQRPMFIIDADGLMNLLSIFLVLLIGLELLETVKAYLKEDIVHVEFIILVAVIAIARKVIVWDFKKYSTEELLSLAAMIIALALSYFLIKRADIKLVFPSKRKNDKE